MSGEFKYVPVKENKILNKLSYTSKYLLMHLSMLTDGLINNVVSFKTIKYLKGITSLSERTISYALVELEDKGAIKVERDFIFGKGRGVNSYLLFERYDLAAQIKQKKIFEHVLKISDLNYLQKLIFFILLKNSNALGEVQKITFKELAREVGVNERTLKPNLRVLIDKDFLYNFLSGGSLSVFSGRTISRFYINNSRFEFTDVQSQKLCSDTFYYDAYDYFMDNEELSGTIQSYIGSLTKQSLIFFISTVVAIADHYTGQLLSKLNKDTLDKGHFITGFIKHLEREVFEIKIGRKLGKVDYAQLAGLIKKTPYYTNIIYEIKKEFFEEREVSNSLLLKEELTNALVFLVFNNAYIFYVKQIFDSYEVVNFAIVRQYLKINNVDDLKERKGILIKKKTSTEKDR
ncbi:hypothetical protein [Thalassotalea sp. SU-HH00458]|uniref:hypothetical protein n=1 Tax=Thalassotalea sp. SU-HH00458 TaxID=3127657 RepID=UPI00310290D7